MKRILATGAIVALALFGVAGTTNAAPAAIIDSGDLL